MQFFLGFFVLLIIAVPFIVLIILSGKLNGLAARVRWLEQELFRLRSAPPPAVRQEPAPVARPPSIVEAQPPSTPPPMREAPPPAAEKPQPSKAREEWEAFVGGKLLNRIGALALIIGVGYFLKYAFDNDWITETMRVAIGAFAGLALLLLGARFHRKAFQVFAQGLIGAGLAILYLSVYASFNFYHLVSQPSAFGLMSAVTLVALVQAFRYDSLAISLLAWAGGYLTPFLLSTGVSNEAGLFSYIGILEAGLITVVLIRREWMILELLTLIGTYIVFSLWYARDYAEDALLLTAGFLTLFWALFYIAEIFRNVTRTPPHPVRQVANILNAVLYGSYLYALVNGEHHEIMGLLMAVLACLYALPAVLALRQTPESPLARDHIMTTVVLLIIATSIQFSGFTTVCLWACEASALIWCARRWGFRYLAGATLAFYIVITGKLLTTEGAFSYVPIDEFTVVLNMRFLAFAVLSASMGLSAHLLMNLEIGKRNLLRASLHAGWCALLFVVLTTETVDCFSTHLSGGHAAGVEFTRNMALLCAWTAFALPLVYFGLRKNVSPVLVSGLVISGVVIAFEVVWALAYQPIEEFRLLLNVRMLAGMLVFGGSIMIARWLRDVRSTLDLADSVYPLLLTCQAMLLLLLLSGETRDLFERQLVFLQQTGDATRAGEQWRSLESMKQLSLSMLWLLYGIALTVVGIWQRRRGMRILAIIILGTAILKIFIYDLSFLQTLYRIFSFMGLGLILLAASYLYQRYKSLIVGNTANGEGGTGERR